MEEITGMVLSWQFLSIGIIVALAVSFLMKIGSMLWKTKVKWVRQIIVTVDGVAPWLPPVFGAVLGALPFWTYPGVLKELSDSQAYVGMILLGLLAGVFYERIWKGTKQIIEARGIDLDLDLPPKEQKAWRKDGG